MEPAPSLRADSESDDELRQMVRRHIIDDRRRQEWGLINCPRTKKSAHASKGIRFVPKIPRLLGHAPSFLHDRIGRAINLRFIRYFNWLESALIYGQTARIQRYRRCRGDGRPVPPQYLRS
jgi:hypothetical protein